MGKPLTQESELRDDAPLKRRFSRLVLGKIRINLHPQNTHTHHFPEGHTSLFMKYTVDKQEHYATISLNEENLNSIIAPDLKSEFVFLRNEGVRNLILDISDVDYVDSSGLSAILTAHRLWKDQGAFVICGVNAASVQRLIKISRLDTILAIMPTHSEAVDYVFLDEVQRDLSGNAGEEE